MIGNAFEFRGYELSRFKYLVLLHLFVCWNFNSASADWPQASGPGGNFVVEGNAVTDFSVSLGNSVRWITPLPSTGQGGVVVMGNRVFVTSHEQVTADTEHGTGILGLCFDANTTL